jgi:short-subunit dehydrogenase
MTMRHILIVGATSAIAEATARRFAGADVKFLLAARNTERLARIAADLRLRGGGEVATTTFNAEDREAPARLVEAAKQALGHIDLALIAYGSLPDQRACERSAELTRQEIEANALSCVDLLTRLAPVFEQQGHGTLAAISSVAGDRGRQSNYVYGAAKGMVTIFMQGLRNRLDRKGVHVLTIKPGFVDTPMTAAFDKKGLLWATPEQIANGIYRAVEKRRDTVYLPWFWLFIMLVIRHIPERVFKRLSL